MMQILASSSCKVLAPDFGEVALGGWDNLEALLSCLEAMPSLASPTTERTLLVASRNPVKIKAAHAAAQRCFPGQTFSVHGVDVPSGVPDQPVGDEETLQGACNRVSSAVSSLDAAQRGLCPLVVGIEGGVLWRGPELHCFAWVVAFQQAGGLLSKARSAEFMLPPAVAALVQDGMELGDADDKVFGRNRSGQGSGTVGVLSHGLITRQSYYEHAVTMALLPFMNAQLYE